MIDGDTRVADAAADENQLGDPQMLEGDTRVSDVAADNEVDADEEPEANPDNLWDTIETGVFTEYDLAKQQDTAAQQAQDEYLTQASLGVVVKDIRQDLKGIGLA